MATLTPNSTCAFNVNISLLRSMIITNGIPIFNLTIDAKDLLGLKINSQNIFANLYSIKGNGTDVDFMLG